jgi:large subunit ribosomal protein L13
MKTYSPKPRDIERRWFVIDASDAVLGRLASEAAAILRGKHKPIFAPHMDTGDHVIVVNAKGIRLTGGKEATKFAYRHSGYPGGITATQYARLIAEKPTYAVEKAIRGMLPKNRLGRAMARKLQVYAGPEHPHQAQKPEALALGTLPRWQGLPEPEARSAAARPPAGRAPSTPPATKPSAAKRPAAKRPTAKRTTSATAKRSTAKRSAAKTITAKRAGAKATTAKAKTAKATTTTRRRIAKKAKKAKEE